MTVCSKCGKENHDHYRFCLGCGAELASAEEEMASAPTTPPLEGSAGAELAPTLPPSKLGDEGQPSDHSDDSAAALACPQCGQENPRKFVFCGACGGQLQTPPGQDSPSGASRLPDSASQAQVPAPVRVAKLSLIRPDGSEGGAHMLDGDEALVGRGSGPLFDHDRYLSPTHACFSRQGDQIEIKDVGSLNGVFVRLVTDQPLVSGDIFRIGQELLRYDAVGDPQPTDDGTEVLGSPNPGYWGRLSLMVSRNVDGSAFPLMGDEMVLGRERGDILFSDDGYVSSTHAKLQIDDRGNVNLLDLGSSNGTFMRLREPRLVPFGTLVLMGQQLFRLDAPA